MSDADKLVRILYLEDDPLDVEPVAERLSQTGLQHELTLASDRKEFEAAIDSGAYDLILVDYLLPAYDGMAAMAYARERFPSVPVILISGVIGEEKAVDCVLNGATDYVLKHHLDRLVPAAQRALSEAEERRRRLAAEEALRVSEARYRTIFQTAREAIWVLDREGRTMLVNARAEQLFGFRAHELIGHHPEKWVGGAGLWPASSSTSAYEEHAAHEVALCAKSGATVHNIVSSSRLTSVNDELDGFVFMLTDITERKRAEQERTTLLAELRRADQLASLGVLAGGMAHDINNVLTPILGVACLNLESSDERLRRDFELINQAAGRGREMIARFLDFARPTQQEKQPLNANDLVHEVVRLLERTTFSKIKIETELCTELPLIQGESSQLLQALMNLCVNAVDAMQDGGSLSLRTRVAQSGNIEIEVEDSGPGITEDALHKVSDPFFTTKPHGTGLGLSIVRGIVEAHMGSVVINSTLGRGTQVTLRLPELDAAAANSTSPPTTSRPFPSSDDLDVLVVDDSDLVLHTTKRLLQRLGHRVSTATSGEQGLNIIESDQPLDLVLLDINMPGLSGVATLRRLRAARPKLAVTVITGALDPPLTSLMEGDPRVKVLPKPFDLHSLQQSITDLLGRQRKR